MPDAGAAPACRSSLPHGRRLPRRDRRLRRARSRAAVAAGRYVFGDLAKPTVLSAALGTDTAPRTESTLPVLRRRASARTAAGGSTSRRSAGRSRGIQDGATGPCVLPVRPAAPGTPPPGGGRRSRHRGARRQRPRREAAAPRPAAARASRPTRPPRRRCARGGSGPARVSLQAGVERVVRLTATTPGPAQDPPGAARRRPAARPRADRASATPRATCRSAGSRCG